MELLKTIPFVKEHMLESKSELQELASALEYQCFANGELIMMQGDIGDRFFLLLKGRCDVFKPVLQPDLDPSSIFVDYDPKTGFCRDNNLLRY